MRFFARFPVLALILMLAVSHVALISHVTAHFEPAWEDCELCVSQAEPLAAVPSSGSCPATEPMITAGPEYAPRQCFTVWTGFRLNQRAPPKPSS